MITKIDKAVEFATVAHDGQYRKASTVPYIVHPLSVGLLLMSVGASNDVVIAGILHDTEEDTSVTFIIIEKEFGSYVAELVKGVSEPDKSLSWEERKTHTIQFIQSATKDIQMITLADKIHNMRSIYKAYEEEGESIWKHFKRGKEKQKWYYESIYHAVHSNQSQEKPMNQLLVQYHEILFKLFTD